MTEGSQERARVGLLADLRERILSGKVEPGSELTQVALAKDLGVSRTPLREVLRVLEGEGIVQMQSNGRVTVTTIELEDLEQLYGMRITLETFACQLSVPALTDAQLDDLGAALDEMAVAGQDIASWEIPHRRFHLGLIQHAGAQVNAELTTLGHRARLYRHVYLSTSAHGWGYQDDAHRAIYDAARERDGLRTAREMANHLAHTALIIIARADPTWEPRGVRAALRAALDGCGGSGSSRNRAEDPR